MSASSKITCGTDAVLGEPSYLPAINPSFATVEEVDDWLFAHGARLIGSTELREFLANVRWSDIPGENPGDPGFPFQLLSKGE